MLDAAIYLDNLSTLAYHDFVKTIQVGVLKSKFSEVLERVRTGEKVAVSFGRKKEKVAVIVPFSEYSKKQKRKLGLLQNQARMNIRDNFTISDDELLKL